MIIGLTGGIASGKSLVSSELRSLGARIIDADLIAREIVEPGSPAYNEIVLAFGPGVLNHYGAINRKALGDIVFSDHEKLKTLNSITHPRIIDIIKERIENIRSGGLGTDPMIIVDAAILIEAGIHKDMDKVIVVYADEDKRIERLKRRNGLTEEEALNRIHAQMPLKDKRRYADFIIENNGTMEEAAKAASEVFKRLKTLKKRVDSGK